MWLPALGLLTGILAALLLSLSVPADLARYSAVGILAALDSILGAVRAELEDEYDNGIFLSGLVVNTLLAALLTFLGDRLGVDLYLAAIMAFGIRLFNNLAIIRRYLFRRAKRVVLRE